MSFQHNAFQQNAFQVGLPGVAGGDASLGWYVKRPAVRLATLVTAAVVSHGVWVPPVPAKPPQSWNDWTIPDEPIRDDGFFTSGIIDDVAAPTLNFGWYRYRAQPVIQAAKGGVSRAIFVAPPEVTQPFNFGWHVTRKPVAAKPLTAPSRLAWVPPATADAVLTPSELGWFLQARPVTAKPVFPAPRNAWVPQDFGQAPPFGWFVQARVRTVSTLSLQGIRTVWVPPAPADAVVEQSFGWFIQQKPVRPYKVTASYRNVFVPQDYGGTVTPDEGLQGGGWLPEGVKREYEKARKKARKAERDLEETIRKAYRRAHGLELPEPVIKPKQLVAKAETAIAEIKAKPSHVKADRELLKQLYRALETLQLQVIELQRLEEEEAAIMVMLMLS